MAACVWMLQCECWEGSCRPKRSSRADVEWVSADGLDLLHLMNNYGTLAFILIGSYNVHCKKRIVLLTKTFVM